MSVKVDVERGGSSLSVCERGGMRASPAQIEEEEARQREGER